MNLPEHSPAARVPTAKDLAFQEAHGVLPWEAFKPSPAITPASSWSFSLLLSSEGIEFEGTQPARLDLQRCLRGVKLTFSF